MWYCAEHGDFEGMRRHLLVDRVPPDLIRDSDGETALILAIKGGFEDIVRLLLDCGSNREMPNRAGQKPLNISVRGRHSEITGLLSNYTGTLPKELRVPGQSVIQCNRPAFCWFIKSSSCRKSVG